MWITRSVSLAGVLLLPLGVAAASGGLAADAAHQPVLRSDVVSSPAPTFPLPSDHVFGSQEPFTQVQNPHTGALTPSDPVGAPTLGFIDQHFLTYDYYNATNSSYHIRADDTFTSCQYYLKIGAVTGCSPFGDLQNPITFDRWKKDVQIDQYAQPVGAVTDRAQFINQVDLNLTRDHHMISYGPSKLAAYVCNYKPPAASVTNPTGYFPTQTEIDAAINEIKVNPQNYIACVAMEFSARGAPVGTKPFTKFWIFGPGPEGILLSAVDLDGRGAKGVPNVCTACHGGDFSYVNEAGQFDHTKSPNGDLAAHFLPFDKANFAFSSKLSAAQQEMAIFKMNLDVYTTENSLWTTIKSGPQAGFLAPGSYASSSIAQLIQGWYGSVTPQNLTPLFNTQFVPFNGWDDDGPFRAAYLHSVSHSCRTCHVAMERWAFEVNPGLVKSSARDVVCNQTVTPYKQFSMPNSKVTFDRFWLSQQPLIPGQPAQPPGGQPYYLAQLAGQSCNGP